MFLAKHSKGPKLSVAQIAAFTRCSSTVVRKWIQRYEETGEVDELPHTGRLPIVNQKTDYALADLLEKTLKLQANN